MNRWLIVLFLFAVFIIAGDIKSHCFAEEKEDSDEVHGVSIASMDIPMYAKLGDKVLITIVVGNERLEKVDTTLTVTCHETGRQIGKDDLSLKRHGAQRMFYSWETEGLEEGDYWIHAKVEEIPGETDLDDNARGLKIELRR